MQLIQFTPVTKKNISLNNLPAPTWKEIKQFCKANNVQCLYLRRSSRSFTGWVCVAGFDILDCEPEAASKACKKLSKKALNKYFAPDAFIAVRNDGYTVKCSIPCIPRDLYALVIRNHHKLPRLKDSYKLAPTK